MSNFLSNIISRHTSGENSVRPRRKSVFEKKQPYSGSLSPSLESEENLSNSVATSSQENSLTSKVDKTHTTGFPIENNKEIQNFQFQKQKEVLNRKETYKIENSTSQRVISKPLKKFKTEIKRDEVSKKIEQNKVLSNKKSLGILKNEKPEKVVLNTIAKAKEILVNQENNEEKVKSIDQIEKTLSKQIETSFHIDNTNVNHNNEIHQDLISQLTIRNLNEKKSHNTDNNTPVGSKVPTIKIQIGRIDIKAIKQTPTKQLNTGQQNKSGSSLEQFLKKRENK